MNNKRRILGLLLLPIGAILVNAARAEYLRTRDACAQGSATQAAQGTQLAAIGLKADLSDKALYVEEDGKVIQTYAIAEGKGKYPTPRGTFRVGKVVWHPAWRPPEEKCAKGKTAKDPGHPDNPMKLVKIFFQEPDYYIHGTDELDTLGSSASHGCLRMDPLDAAGLAIRVMEASGAQKDSSWYQNAIERGETRTVRLPRKLELVISG
jgi:lipoprotein-anchoring transpeptidase ErfK/SrfK